MSTPNNLSSVYLHTHSADKSEVMDTGFSVQYKTVDNETKRILGLTPTSTLQHLMSSIIGNEGKNEGEMTVQIYTYEHPLIPTANTLKCMSLGWLLWLMFNCQY